MVARYLANDGIPVTVYLLAARDQVQGDALVNLKILAKLNVELVEILGEDRLNDVLHHMSRARCDRTGGEGRERRKRRYLLLYSRRRVISSGS